MGSWAKISPQHEPPLLHGFVSAGFRVLQLLGADLQELFSTTTLSQGRTAFKGVLESIPLTPNSLDVQNLTE